MKVIYIIDSLRRHGTQRFLVHLTRGLHQRGYEQAVINLGGAGDADVTEALRDCGCSVSEIGKGSLLAGGAGWFRLVGQLRRGKPDIVLTLLPVADTLGRPAARVAGCPIILSSIRARNLDKPQWQRWWDRRSVRWARKVVFNSRHITEFACREEGVRAEQAVVIPNGVEDLRATAGDLRGRTRRELRLGEDTILLGGVARLYPQKNLPLLLRACASVMTAAKWKLVIVGDGPERRRLEALAQELGLSAHVIWAGAQRDVARWLSAMDIFIHTADFEGMPNAVMEAMSMGLAVIASRVDGTKELIHDGSSGCLVDPGNAGAFAERLNALLTDTKRRRELGEQAHRDIIERFSIPRMIAAYDDLFASLAVPRAA